MLLRCGRERKCACRGQRQRMLAGKLGRGAKRCQPDWAPEKVSSRVGGAAGIKGICRSGSGTRNQGPHMTKGLALHRLQKAERVLKCGLRAKGWSQTVETRPPGGWGGDSLGEGGLRQQAYPAVKGSTTELYLQAAASWPWKNAWARAQAPCQAGRGQRARESSQYSRQWEAQGSVLPD